MRSLGLALIIVIGQTALAYGTDATLRRTMAIAHVCTVCHGPEGRGTGAIPSVVGRNQDDLGELLRAFRDGRRNGTVMPRLLQGVSESEIDALAAYFAALKPLPRRK